MIKNFQKRSTYILVNVISAIIALLILYILSYPAEMLLDSLLNTNPPSRIIIFLVLALLFLLSFYFMKKVARSALENFVTTTEAGLDMLPQEKIIIARRPCLLCGMTLLSRTWEPRSVIVTNQRILIGVVNTVPFYLKGKMDEKFGYMNLWRSDFKEPPVTTNNIFGSSLLERFLKGNTVIDDIAWGIDGKDPFLLVRPKMWLPTYLKIYHPEAERIYSLQKKQGPVHRMN